MIPSFPAVFTARVVLAQSIIVDCLYDDPSVLTVLPSKSFSIMFCRYNRFRLIGRVSVVIWPIQDWVCMTVQDRLTCPFSPGGGDGSLQDRKRYLAYARKPLMGWHMANDTVPCRFITGGRKKQHRHSCLRFSFSVKLPPQSTAQKQRHYTVWFFFLRSVLCCRTLVLFVWGSVIWLAVGVSGFVNAWVNMTWN